jgi:hypothetical protein
MIQFFRGRRRPRSRCSRGGRRLLVRPGSASNWSPSRRHVAHQRPKSHPWKWRHSTGSGRRTSAPPPRPPPRRPGPCGRCRDSLGDGARRIDSPGYLRPRGMRPRARRAMTDLQIVSSPRWSGRAGRHLAFMDGDRVGDGEGAGAEMIGVVEYLLARAVRRSIRPTRATTSLAASVDHTDARNDSWPAMPYRRAARRSTAWGPPGCRPGARMVGAGR